MNTDWKCAGCLCNHNKKVKKQGSINNQDYCEQTYFNAASKAGIYIDKQKLAAKYKGAKS